MRELENWMEMSVAQVKALKDEIIFFLQDATFSPKTKHCMRTSNNACMKRKAWFLLAMQSKKAKSNHQPKHNSSYFTMKTASTRS